MQQYMYSEEPKWPCPKCGAHNPNMRFQVNSKKLKCTCLKCDYSWDEETLDKRDG